LIEILSQTRNPHAVQPHLNKCFDAIKSITFTNARNSIEITHMTSPEDEQVAFSRSVYAEGNVEHWMTNIETMMVKSLYDITFKCLNEYPETGLNRKVWFFNYPA
jgi:dynein heavy chain